MPFDKIALRRELRAALRTLEGRAEKSRALCAAVAAHPAYRAASTVALFDAMPVEPHVELLWAMAPRRFLYPRLEGVELVLHEVKSVKELLAVEGVRYREPDAALGAAVDPREVEMILVPGLGFTREGQRLGRGGGHYDRLLARLPAGAVKLGICFAVQLVDSLPVEPHDLAVDAVITEYTPAGSQAPPS